MNNNIIIYGVLILVSIYIILNLTKKKKETFYMPNSIKKWHSTYDSSLCDLEIDETSDALGNIYDRIEHKNTITNKMVYGQSKKVKVFKPYCNRKILKTELESLQHTIIDGEMFDSKVYINRELIDLAQYKPSDDSSDKIIENDTLHGIVKIKDDRYSQFSYIFWIKIDELNDKDRVVISRGGEKSDKNPSFEIIKNSTSLKITLDNKEIILASGDIKFNQWAQVCLVLNGNKIDVYINTIHRYKGEFNNFLITNNSTPLWINSDRNTGILLKNLVVIPIAVSFNYVKYILGHYLNQNNKDDHTKYERCVADKLKQTLIPINDNWDYVPKTHNSDQKDYIGLIQSKHGLCLQNNGNNNVSLSKCNYSENINQKWNSNNNQLASMKDNKCITFDNDNLILDACDPNNSSQRNNIINKMVTSFTNVHNDCIKYKPSQLKKYPILVNSTSRELNIDNYLHNEQFSDYNYKLSGPDAISGPTQLLTNGIVFLNGLIKNPKNNTLALLTPKYKPPSGQMIFMCHDNRNSNGEHKDLPESTIKKNSNLVITQTGNVNAKEANNNITQDYFLDSVSYPLNGEIENLVYNVDRRCYYVRIFKNSTASLTLHGVEIYNNSNIIKENLNITYSNRTTPVSANISGNTIKLNNVPTQEKPFIMINFQFPQIISQVDVYSHLDITQRENIRGLQVQLLDYNKDIIEMQKWKNTFINFQNIDKTNNDSSDDGWNSKTLNSKKCVKWNNRTPYAAVHGIEGKYGITETSYRDGIHNYKFTDSNNDPINKIIQKRVIDNNTKGLFPMNNGTSNEGTDFSFNCGPNDNPITSFNFNTNERVEGFTGKGPTTEHFANNCDSTLEECCNKFTRGAFATKDPNKCKIQNFGLGDELQGHLAWRGDGDAYKSGGKMPSNYICPKKVDKTNWVGSQNTDGVVNSYVLAPNKKTCGQIGASNIKDKNECNKGYKSIKNKFQYPAVRSFAEGSWGDLPTNCSIQYEGPYVQKFSDQTPHYNHHTTPNSSRLGEFRAICKKTVGGSHPNKFKIKGFKYPGNPNEKFMFANRTDAKNHGWGMNLAVQCCEDPGVCTAKPEFERKLKELQDMATNMDASNSNNANMKLVIQGIVMKQRQDAKKFYISLTYPNTNDVSQLKDNDAKIQQIKKKILAIKMDINKYDMNARNDLVSNKYNISNWNTFLNYDILVKIKKDLDIWVVENEKKLQYTPDSSKIANLNSLKIKATDLKNTHETLQKNASDLGITKVYEKFSNITDYKSNPFVREVIDKVSNLDNTMSNLGNLGSVKCNDGSNSKYNNAEFIISNPNANSRKISIKNYLQSGPKKDHLDASMCRNPGKPGNTPDLNWNHEDKLWCYTNESGTDWEYCKIDDQYIPDSSDSNTQLKYQNLAFNMTTFIIPTGAGDVLIEDGTSYQKGFSSLNNGIIHIGGYIKMLEKRVFTEFKTIAVLPPKFRPSTRKIFNVSVNGNIGRVDILANGSIRYIGPGKSSNGEYIKKTSLSGIRYTIENGDKIKLNSYYQEKNIDTIILDGFSKQVIYGIPKVVIINNIVSLSGVMKMRDEFLATEYLEDYAILGVLDSKFWPSRDLIFHTNQGTNSAQIRIKMNGVIQANNIIMNRIITLDGIMYPL